MMDIDLSILTLDPLTTGFTITGNTNGDILGFWVSAAGDMNKDGYDDIILGAPWKSGFQGAVYVIYGGEKSKMMNIDLSLTPLNPLATGFMITGNAANDLFGWSVSSSGDINKDGYDDIIIGAPFKNGNQGATYVVYGGAKVPNVDLSTTTLDPLTTGFTMIGSGAGDYFGYSACSADFNNDGNNDLIIGAYGKSSNKGATYLIYGESCSAYCTECSSDSKCTQCTSTKLLYQSECIDTCPTTTFGSARICKDCPSHCSVCASQESCQVCSQGYFLFNSLCVLTPPSSQTTQQNAYQAISSTAKGIGSVVSTGNAIFPLSALVSKIVQNTRYLNLTVTDDLAEIYQTWDTDLISWQPPNVLSNDEDHFKTPPILFARYELDSSFLTNFWPTLLNILIGLAVFMICYLLKSFLKRAKFEGWIYSLVQKLMAGSFNFALVQASTCLDDILFYLVLDAKTNPFDGFFSKASFICAVIFLIFGCLLVLWNFWLVKKYQNVKSNKKNLEEFNEKNKYWELFYSDFNDLDLWSQSFFATLIIRSTLSSLIIVIFYDYPLMQTSFLVILDGVIMLFLYFKNPFKTLRGKLAQWVFEIITLSVHIFAFILSFQGSLENPSQNLKVVLSTGIIHLNTGLVSGGLGFMFIEIYETIRAKIKERRAKRRQSSVNEENQEVENLNRTDSPPLKPQAEKRANFNLSVESQFNNSNIAILGVNVEPFDSNLNGDNSFGPDMRDQSPVPIIRPKLRVFKPQRNEYEIEGQAKNAKELKNNGRISFGQKLPE